MHDPEQFQKETVKAITDLQNMLAQTLSRQLALGAMVKAILGRVPPAGLPLVLEEYEAEVLAQIETIHPKYQQPQHWENWTDVITALQAQVQQHQDSKNKP